MNELENPFRPTDHFKKLARDLHDIRVERFMGVIQKALEMKKCIESFLRDPLTSEEERKKVSELLEGLRESKERKAMEQRIKEGRGRNARNQ
jgi:hypothetical protein